MAVQVSETRRARLERPEVLGGKAGPGRAWLLAAPFLLPALVFYTLFLIVPLVGTVLLSFTEWSGFRLSDMRFVGLDNYRAMASDPIFWLSLKHNLIFLAGSTVTRTLVALLLALALDQRLPGSDFFRGIYLMPTVLSMVVISVVFSLILSPSLGLINPLLQHVGLGRFAGDWLGDPGKVLWILILIHTWQGFGLSMFLYIARLVAIPQELYEAAAVDGATRLQSIWHVTLPLLRSMTTMIVLLAAIDSLKVFAHIYVMTRGGPNHHSEVLSTWAYFQAFTSNKVGYGSAVLVVLLVITFVLAYIQVTRFQPREEH